MTTERRVRLGEEANRKLDKQAMGLYHDTQQAPAGASISEPSLSPGWQRQRSSLDGLLSPWKVIGEA